MSRKLYSMVNRLEYGFAVSAAGLSPKLVAKWQASTIPFAFRHTAAPS